MLGNLLLCDYGAMTNTAVCVLLLALFEFVFNDITNPKVLDKGWGHSDAHFSTRFPLLHSLSVCSSCTKERTKERKKERMGKVFGFSATGVGDLKQQKNRQCS